MLEKVVGVNHLIISKYIVKYLEIIIQFYATFMETCLIIFLVFFFSFFIILFCLMDPWILNIRWTVLAAEHKGEMMQTALWSRFLFLHEAGNDMQQGLCFV